MPCIQREDGTNRENHVGNCCLFSLFVSTQRHNWYDSIYSSTPSPPGHQLKADLEMDLDEDKAASRGAAAIAGKPFGVIKRGWQRNSGHASVNGKIIYE